MCCVTFVKGNLEEDVLTLLLLLFVVLWED